MMNTREPGEFGDGITVSDSPYYKSVRVPKPEWGKIVSMTTHKDRIIIACEYAVVEAIGEELVKLEFVEK